MTNHYFLCMCPVYGTPPHLLEESIQCFVDQTYDERFLLIYDDLGTLEGKLSLPEKIGYVSTRTRSPTLNEKYEWMSKVSSEFTAAAIWEVDDIYLPNHLEEHNRILQSHPFSYPEEVWVTGLGYPSLEKTHGNLFASCAIRIKELRECGGFVTSGRADSDLQSIARFKTLGYAGGKPTYVFRWGDTDGKHAQGYMQSPEDETWYTEFEPQYTEPITEIKPQYRPATAAWIKTLLCV